VAKPEKKKKKSGLAAAASRKLARIGGGPNGPTSPADLAHMLLHAEERGEVQRVTLDDGSWAWSMVGPDGKTQILKPTPEMLEALERFEREGHPGH
jgi:hypothetical protein